MEPQRAWYCAGRCFRDSFYTARRMNPQKKTGWSVALYGCRHPDGGGDICRRGVGWWLDKLRRSPYFWLCFSCWVGRLASSMVYRAFRDDGGGTAMTMDRPPCLGSFGCRLSARCISRCNAGNCVKKCDFQPRGVMALTGRGGPAGVCGCGMVAGVSVHGRGQILVDGRFSCFL